MARKKYKRGGLTKGKSHAKGGMPMDVKSTGQKVELEGGEGVINKYVMSSKDKYTYDGREATACEIASDLNQKTGNGVSFDCNETKNTDMTPTDPSTGFAKGGDVSDKVKFLMEEEGYPQDQAVAIALSMRDSGKLAKGGTTMTREERVRAILDSIDSPNVMRGDSVIRIRVEKSDYNFTIDEISKIQRTQIYGGDAQIMKTTRRATDFSIFEFPYTNATQLKSLPNYTIVNVKGKKYRASKSYDANYLFPFREVIEKFLKTIASPIYIAKEYGRFRAIDGWSGDYGNNVLDRNYTNSRKKYTQYQVLGSIYSFFFSKEFMYSEEGKGFKSILEKYFEEEYIDVITDANRNQSLIVDLDRAFALANRDGKKAYDAVKSLYQKVAWGLDPNLANITGYETDLMNTTFGGISPRLFDSGEDSSSNIDGVDKPKLTDDNYINLSVEIMAYVNSKEFLDIQVKRYNQESLNLLNETGILSPSFKIGELVEPKQRAVKTKFDRDESFLGSQQLKDVKTLQNLMAIYSDTPNALKEMNQAIRKLENSVDKELNLEGKEVFNLKSAFTNYFKIASQPYTAQKKINRTNALAPSGQRSLLTKKQYDIIRTSNFKQWFGDWELAYETKNYNGVSKALDSDGEPIVVYHGTMRNREFTNFKFETFPVNYFSEDADYAEWFATKTLKGAKSFKFQFFLNVRNPLVMVEFGVEKLTLLDFAFALKEKYGIVLDLSKYSDELLTRPKLPFWAIIREYKKLGLFEIFDTLKKYGFDGVHYIEDNPAMKIDGRNAATKAWMIFDADQAKLSDGRNTTFSTINDDFRFKQGGNVNRG